MKGTLDEPYTLLKYNINYKTHYQKGVIIIQFLNVMVISAITLHIYCSAIISQVTYQSQGL